MFKKLVANAAFSPSMVTTIGFYAKRLRQEEFTRRLGLIFSALAVALQTLAIISPPEATIASGPNNIIYTGVTSVEDLLRHYDRNDDGNGHRDLQQIFAHYGISRDDLADAKITTIKSTDRDRKLRSIGRKPYGKAGEVAVPISDSATTVYERWLWSWDSGPYSTYRVFQGQTSDGRWFAVLMNCGNLVVDEPPPSPENPVGQVEASCLGIFGWAYDPNAKSRAITVKVIIKLRGVDDEPTRFTLAANLPEPKASVGGNHGFRAPIPPAKQSAEFKTAYTVVAIDTYGGGENIDLARNQIIDTNCADTPPPCPFKEGLTLRDKECIECEIVPGIWYKDSECKPPEEPPCPIKPTLPKDDPRCLPCPTDSSKWIDDEDCETPFPLIVFVKRAKNETQGIDDANGTTAQPGDTIIYEIAAENVGSQADEVLFQEDIADILEYADLIDSDDASISDDGNVLSWGLIEVKPDQEIIKRITVRIKDPIPASPSPANNLESNNLELRNVWHHKTVVIKVPRPIVKTPEVLAESLPNTGPTANVAISFGLIMLSAYFYSRNRQLTKELKLVSVEYASGGA
ncbi:MAG TPA: hypothetical protein VGA08_01120 [Candidatus Saccharimonadales bacterium]